MLTRIQADEKAERLLLLEAIRTTNHSKKVMITAPDDETVCIESGSLLKQEHECLLTSLFKHLLLFPESTLTLQFNRRNIFYDELNIVDSMTAADMKDDNAKWDFVTAKLHSRIVKAFLKALYHLNCQFDDVKFSTYLQSLAEKNSNIDDINDITNNMLGLYKCNQREDQLTENLKFVIAELITYEGFRILIDELDENLFRRILEKCDGNPISLLHASLRSSTLGNYPRFILKLMGGIPRILQDEKNNNLLHACRTPALLEEFKQYVPDVDQVNDDGDTALHLAVKDDDFEKFRFLRLHGASPAIPNKNMKSPIAIVSNRASSSLGMYIACVKYGVTLSVPPRVNQQSGLTCGLYAAETATYHHRVTRHGLFKTEFIPARKSNNIMKECTSLRMKAKQNGFTVVGEIFSVTHETEIIAYNNCKSIVYAPRDYADFLSHIRKSLNEDLPVIIPYARDGVSAFSAHWATIIGFYRGPFSNIDIFLVANYGEYDTVNAVHFYGNFRNIQEHYPGCYVYKTETEKWQKSITPPVNECLKQMHLPPLNLCADFNGKLITVCPPDYDIEQFHSLGVGHRPSM